MKERKNNKNLKILAATMVTIFSLFVCFAGTFAWFNAQRYANNGTSGFEVRGDDTSISCSLYKYDVNSDTPVLVTGEGVQHFDLNQYDVVFKERNKYNPMYLKLEISGSSLSTAGGNLTMYLERNTNLPVMDNENNLSNYFTSVTKFAVDTNGFLQGGVYDSADVSNTWDNLNTAFLERDTAGTLTTQSFTSGTRGNYSKSNSLIFAASYDSDDFVDNNLIVYLYINYDSGLAEAYSAEHGLSTEHAGGSMEYSLLNDLTTLRVEARQ